MAQSHQLSSPQPLPSPSLPPSSPSSSSSSPSSPPPSSPSLPILTRTPPLPSLYKRKNKPNPKMIVPRTSGKLNIQENMEETYFFENGLRKVNPYDFTYRTYAKRRWVDKTIENVFTLEFHDRSPAYYEWAVQNGRITIDNKKVTCLAIIKDHNLVCHHLHRHEPPVTDQSIKIVFQSENMLVIDKPSSIPTRQVHPTGRYNHNSATMILKSLYPELSIFPVNRIDRLTSGLCLMALTKHHATFLSNQMQSREIRKIYLAKVIGDFSDEEITCEAPIMVVSCKLALNAVHIYPLGTSNSYPFKVHDNGKPCKTTFKKMSSGRDLDGSIWSIILAKPHTGRTHQIRVHLQYLGYPITNDVLYNDKSCWKDGCSNLTTASIDRVIDAIAKKHFPDDEAEVFGCLDCTMNRPDPSKESLVLFLHALKYEGPDWNFQTQVPDWANSDEILDNLMKDVAISFEEIRV